MENLLVSLFAVIILAGCGSNEKKKNLKHVPFHNLVSHWISKWTQKVMLSKI